MELSNHTVGAVVAVADLGAARRFYEEQLGLRPGDADENGVSYPCADGTSLFVYLSPEHAGQNPATAAGWDVDDLDGLMHELSARGVAFEHYDQPGLKTDERGVFDAGTFRAAWVRDPDGNTFAITQRS